MRAAAQQGTKGEGHYVKHMWPRADDIRQLDRFQAAMISALITSDP